MDRDQKPDPATSGGVVAAPAKFVSPGDRVRAVIAAVASAHRVSAADITGESRAQIHIDARFAAIRAVREAFPRLSLAGLGRHFGNRRHATIINALGGGRSSRKGDKSHG